MIKYAIYPGLSMVDGVEKHESYEQIIARFNLSPAECCMGPQTLRRDLIKVHANTKKLATNKLAGCTGCG